MLLSDTWAGGGASTFVATLARGLAARGEHVDVIVGYRDSPAVDEYAAHVRRVFRPPVDFNRVVLEGDYDILHVTEDDLRPPFDYTRRVRRLGLKVRVVVTSHQEHSEIRRGSADAVVYVSDASQRKAPGVTEGSYVIPNGVDVPWLQAQADSLLLSEGEGPAAVWVGRVEDPLAQKDFLGFCYAINTLLNRGWRVLVIDGSPPSTDHPVAEELWRAFDGRVEYANQVSRATVSGALARAGRSGGAMVSTSRYEAAPFIALEALAVDCPVVTPMISGYSTLLEAHYATGYETLAGLLDVMEKRSFVHARNGVPAHLTAEHMVTRYLDLYSTLRGHDDVRLPARLNRISARCLSDPRVRAVRSLLRRVRV